MENGWKYIRQSDVMRPASATQLNKTVVYALEARATIAIM